MLNLQSFTINVEIQTIHQSLMMINILRCLLLEIQSLTFSRLFQWMRRKIGLMSSGMPLKVNLILTLTLLIFLSRRVSVLLNRILWFRNLHQMEQVICGNNQTMLKIELTQTYTLKTILIHGDQSSVGSNFNHNFNPIQTLKPTPFNIGTMVTTGLLRSN